jgi:cytochrome c-type protein NapC
MWTLLKTYWRVFNRPSAYIGLGTLSMGGFIAGIIFWGGFNTALEYTNTEQFCIGCHEMQANPYQELIPTIHYTNRSGVRAVCSDCHVPHDWTYKIARKMEASKEVWGWIFGTRSWTSNLKIGPVRICETPPPSGVVRTRKCQSGSSRPIVIEESRTC